MTSCTICSAPTAEGDDLCAWCDIANFAGTEGRTPPQPWWVALRPPLAPKRDGLRALTPPQEDAP